MANSLILLGPQRLEPNLVSAFDALGIEGAVAAITAGWQEREGEDEELEEHLGRPVVDLALHRRLEEVFEKDSELFELHRQRQDRLQDLQRLYRYRLDFLIEPARGLLRREDEPEILAPEQESAIAALRHFDAEHLARIAAVHQEFENRVRPLERPAIAGHRRELAEILAGSASVAIAGGHVAVLLNRMRLFGVASLFGDRPIFAWSAGAMALADRVVLFHDSPPQGAGSAEVFDVGLGLAPAIVPLPHAKQRLRLGDPYRVALFARRFAPALCALLDLGVTLELRDGSWRPLTSGRRLDVSGTVDDLTVEEPEVT